MASVPTDDARATRENDENKYHKYQYLYNEASWGNEIHVRVQTSVVRMNKSGSNDVTSAGAAMSIIWEKSLAVT